MPSAPDTSPDTIIDPRYQVLFEPLRIGPVTTRNRFYQVPHCAGMGYRDPAASAAMRATKAEGGWGVVCTEEVEIHYSSDITPAIELRLWDDTDAAMLATIADAVHRHDSLAGIELAYNGLNSANLHTREPPMAPVALPVTVDGHPPVQARRMDKTDIKNLRRWHKRAALRARDAGFDIVYVYAAHGLGFFHHFLSRRYNDRTDEYGGSLENRVRLLREITEDTKDAIGDRCAVPVRLSVDALAGSDDIHREEAEDMIASMAEVPDLWDVALAGWENDSPSSRFTPEGYEEPFIGGIKKLTSKPVVGVGRYTSPDRMASLIRKGVLDLIGAARPSIADPFLPRKIEEGRLEDIRECIGCNICVSGDMTMSPIRCTQNPSMGEEWRRGWHPERLRPRASDDPVLIVGAGPAGMEAAMALGKRGYDVTLADASRTPGGRVTRESALPGLAAWARVRDYRQAQFHKLANVKVFPESPLTADDVLAFGMSRVAIATGARWRTDGVGRRHPRPIPISADMDLLSPDDIMDGRMPAGGQVMIWDDDHYYMGGVLAEKLADAGLTVIYMTPAAEASTWTRNTMEQRFIQTRLLEKGVAIKPFASLESVEAAGVRAACTFTGREEFVPVESLVLVTARLPDDALLRELHERRDAWDAAGIRSVTAIGDALAPATIAHAVYAGRRYAEEMDDETLPADDPPFRREYVTVAGDALR